MCRVFRQIGLLTFGESSFLDGASQTKRSESAHLVCLLEVYRPAYFQGVSTHTVK